ncbi:MAG: peptidase domain-containing ABC transporter [Rhodospirillaceae bacterium]|jgi:ATP-binding cassette, subfamily C, bacterial LapB|nr:peptidase domain-containing ABC transporter [Rhodospirillaceae bacterium]MBT5192618.1 peptidase domain-containing ABC transporter [Rhodospirillaceae bacterium]MBT5894285.1 peptidase domain-containing ABC transporter [Rhodospirillaceae bacterium]MBT7759514.1 peptidase domain-containing ABC transporter [Rhodospirillaceae bacterium]
MSAAGQNTLDRRPQWLDGMNVLEAFRRGGAGALSDLGACLLRLLEALEWNGKERHLAEAVPHFVPNLDLKGFRETLSNLNLSTRPLRVRHDRINANLMPCLFLPDNPAAPIRIVVSADEDGYRIYDGAYRMFRQSSGKGLRGTAYVVKDIDRAEREKQQKNRSWASPLAGRFRTLISQVILLTLLFNILSLAMPLFMMSIYDKVIPSASVNQLLFLVSGVALAISLETGLRRLRIGAMAYLAGRIDYLVGRSAFERILFLPLSMLEHEPLGAQLAHLQEFESLREFFAGPLGEALLDLPFVVIYLVVIAALGGWLVLVPICAGLAYVLAGLAITAITKHFAAAGNEHKAEQQKFLVQAISGMRAIKFAGSEKVWLERYRELSAASALREFVLTRHSNAVQTVSRVITLASGIALMGFGALGVMDDGLSIGALIASMALVWRALAPLQSGFMTLNRLAQIKSSLRQINHLMRLPTERIPGQVPFKRAFKGRIVFNSVAHRFSADAELALLGVTFSIEPGEVVAITGPNGSGKSTLINITAGLYRPTMGAILIDGIDVRQVDPIDLRQSVALAPQATELTYGTVAQNLRLAEPTASDEDLIEAAKLARVYDGIMQLPEQFETRLNEHVLTELTEGFKQKLSLARAYLKKSPIMLFDEPGQALDAEGDQAFLAAVQKLRGSSTIIIVTHRPSHMEIADRLLVLDAGRLQYNGPPQEAMDRLSGGGQ